MFIQTYLAYGILSLLNQIHQALTVVNIYLIKNLIYTSSDIFSKQANKYRIFKLSLFGKTIVNALEQVKILNQHLILDQPFHNI